MSVSHLTAAVLTLAVCAACSRTDSEPEPAPGEPAGGAPAGAGGQEGLAGGAGFTQGGAAGAPPLPDGETLLYELGTAEGSRVDRLLLDDPYLYWFQLRRELYRAPRDGSGPIEVFGMWENTWSGSRIESDGEFIYWLDRTTLRRKRRDGGDTESVDLGEDYGTGEFVLEGGTVYLAQYGCPYFLQVSTADLAVEPFGELVEGQVRTSGSTHFALHGSSLVCGQAERVVEVPLDGSPYSVLTEALTGLRALASADGTLYAFDYIAGNLQRLYRLDTEGGLTLLVESALGAGSRFLYDAERGEFFWGPGIIAGGGFFRRYSVDTGELSTFGAERGTGAGLAMDRDYLYFGNWQTRETQFIRDGSLRRLEK